MNKKCLGCGITLQNTDQNKDGYVMNDGMDLCMRCFMIKNYGKYSSTFKSNVDYMKIFDNIDNRDLVIYVSSILTLNLDYINKFKNVLLVITKRDIMPKSIKDGKIVKYIKDRYENILDIEIISSYKNYNLDNLYEKIKKYSFNKKVYFVGATNSGKSTLINKLFKNYTNDDIDITTSHYPSTTIDLISIKFNDLMFYDTPGIVLDGSIINYLDSKYMKMINNKMEIKPSVYQIHGCGSLLIENLIRIDYDTLESSIVIYVSNNLNIKNNSLKNDLLKDKCVMELKNIKNKDIVFEDLGFIKVTDSVSLKIYSKYSIQIKERDNLI